MKSKSKKLISVEEYVRINGINQYLFHSGTNMKIQYCYFCTVDLEVLNHFLHTPFKKNGKVFLP
jgi:hypothetical protein